MPPVTGMFSRSCSDSKSYCGVCVDDAVADSGLRDRARKGRSLKAAAQRDQQVPGDVVLREARLLGLGAVHVDVQLGLVEGLLDAQIGDARDTCCNCFSRLLGKLAIRFDIVAHDLDVDRRGQAEVQDLADDVGGQESRTSRPGIRCASLQAQVVNVLVGGPMLLRQRDQDVGVVGADGRRSAVGQIDAAVGQADVVDDAVNFFVRNLLADRPLDVGRRAPLFLRCACGAARARAA